MTSRYASEEERERLLENFIRLCEIPSPFGAEEEISEYVTGELRRMGLKVEQDETASESGAACGNLLTRIDAGGRDSFVLFCAHLDTVPLADPVKVVREDGYLTNDYEAILGADNKAAVAMLLELARRYSQEQPPVGLELLFTVSEENGLAGSKAFDVKRLRSEFGFVFDHPTPIGELLVATPTHQFLKARFSGVGAHAGVRPELGRSAIAAAAKAVESMKLGRIDEDSTANVGLIEGGSAVNVVAESCRIKGEARSLDHQKSLELVQGMVDACNWAAGVTGNDVQVVVEEKFRAYRLGDDAPSVEVASAALSNLGLTVTRKATGGGSDANALFANGFECLNVANGTEANHTSSERVSVSALETTLEVGHSILAQVSKR